MQLFTVLISLFGFAFSSPNIESSCKVYPHQARTKKSSVKKSAPPNNRLGFNIYELDQVVNIYNMSTIATYAQNHTKVLKPQTEILTDTMVAANYFRVTVFLIILSAMVIVGCRFRLKSLLNYSIKRFFLLHYKKKKKFLCGWYKERKKTESIQGEDKNKNLVNYTVNEHIQAIVKVLKNKKIDYKHSFLSLDISNSSKNLNSYEFAVNYLRKLELMALNNTSWSSLFGASYLDVENYAYTIQYLCNQILSNQAATFFPFENNSKQQSNLFTLSDYTPQNSKQITSDNFSKCENITSATYWFSLDRLNELRIKITGTRNKNGNVIKYQFLDIEGKTTNIFKQLCASMFTHFKLIAWLMALMLVVSGLVYVIDIVFEVKLLTSSLLINNLIAHKYSYAILLAISEILYIFCYLTKSWVKSKQLFNDFQSKLNNLPAELLDFSFDDTPIFHPEADKLNFTNIVRDLFYGYINNKFYPNAAKFIILDGRPGTGKTSLMNLIESKSQVCTPDLFSQQKRLSEHSHCKNKAFIPIVRQSMIKEDITFIRVSMLELCNVFQEHDKNDKRLNITAESLIKFIARNAPKKYSKIFVNLIESVEVNVSWLTIKISALKDVLFHKSVFHRVVVVFEDADRLGVDELQNIFLNLSVLKNIPSLMVILPLDKSLLFTEASNVLGLTPKEEKKKKINSLFIKLVSAEVPVNKMIVAALSNLYIDTLSTFHF